MDDRPTVYALEPGEVVGCYFCQGEREWTEYGRGEAVLAGPDYPPYDGNANYICMRHLDDDVVIVDLYARRVGLQYERADGRCVCDDCGRPYSRHPDHIDHDWLKTLCDGRNVKL